MKKLIPYVILLCTIVTMSISEAKATARPAALEMNIEITEANVLVKRLHEIKAMDVSTLNRHERKELRKEVRAIDNKLKSTHGGQVVYLSAGAIIIILLLIILLF